MENLMAHIQVQSSNSASNHPRSALDPSTLSLVAMKDGPSAGFHASWKEMRTASSALQRHTLSLEIMGCIYLLICIAWQGG
jgi:hypothetical protein